ncbi:hypothetical protein LHJ74_04715 [Streptomyces sp. N2-109]|uniref:Integral membrane protein n=1 Tax=Streptomyces gossypii TaxID=2883101 RepID=A0ABT2JNC4_9ACTN|nr:hypothetical protein [Streptomyces gossypii]MCT2589241.1 hypothetical protein [Streptomyces gossypii]
MAQAARSSRGFASRLNTDGKAHPVQNTFVAATVLLGAVAFVTALITEREWANLHLLASWAGMAGILTGGWGQFISATTAERFLLVLGLGAAAVGLFLGIAYGGPFGGLLG